MIGAVVLVAGVMLPVAASSADPSPSDQIQQVEAEIAALQVKSEAATEAYNAGVIAQASSERAAAAADGAVARERTALDAQTGMARQLAAAEYRDGGVGKLLTLVGSGDPSAFLEQASTLSSISTSQAREIAGLQAAAKRLSDAQAFDAAKQAAVKVETAQLAQAQANVVSLINQQNNILNGLKAQQRAEILAQQQAAERAAAAAAASERAAAAAQAAAAEAAAANAAAAQPANSTAAASGAAAPPTIPASARASVALSAAYAEIGKPYVYGGAGPDAFDCSGLTMWAFAKAGIALPHSAAAQYGYGTHVSYSQLEPGDLVFFDEGGGIGHVGIYAGNGTMVDAPHSGSDVGVHALYPGFVGGTRL